jgi:hypothetical protein
MNNINYTIYLRLIELGLVNLRPWRILPQLKSSEYSKQLANRYPNRNLIPFAIRSDCDDVGCWDLSKNANKIYIIHDFASSGWEHVREYESFEAWLSDAIQTMINFED